MSKQVAYAKLYGDYDFYLKKLELTGRCKKVIGGVYPGEYIEIIRYFFWIFPVKTWVRKDNISFYEEEKEEIYQCKEIGNETGNS